MRLVNHPILCNYYLTYRCNAKCGFCDIWEKPSPYADLETVKKNLIDLKKLGVKVIDFTGGEPLLHRQLGEMLTEAKKLGFITTVTTNTLLYPKQANNLKGKVDMLHFSLDSSVKEEHDQMRGVACFDSVIDSIKLAKSLSEKPDILFTVFPDNIEELGKVYEQITLPNDLVLIVNPEFSYGDVNSENQLSHDQLIYLERFGKKKKVYLNQAFIQLRKDGGNSIDKPVCKAASTTVLINPENELVVPCYHLGEKSFPIENELFKLYQSSEVGRLIDLEGKLPACQGCVINCYMQPSFAVEVNKYWWKALPSTLKYNRLKGTWKQLFV